MKTLEQPHIQQNQQPQQSSEEFSESSSKESSAFFGPLCTKGLSFARGLLKGASKGLSHPFIPMD